MPLKPPVKKKPAKKTSHKTDLIMGEIKALMRHRRKYHKMLLELHEEYEEVFDKLAEIQSEVQVIETQVKDQVRKLYKEGHTRGIYTVHEDPAFRIKATVKYGRDAVDPEELMKRFPKSVRKLPPGLIVQAMEVDMPLFHKYVEEGKLPEKALTLVQRGDMKTTQVTIQDRSKTETSYTEE